MHYKAAWACGQAALRLAHMPTRCYDHHRLSPLVSTRNDEGPPHLNFICRVFPGRATGQKPNWAFNVDANSGHAFGILLAAVGALRPYGATAPVN